MNEVVEKAILLAQTINLYQGKTNCIIQCYMFGVYACGLAQRVAFLQAALKNMSLCAIA